MAYALMTSGGKDSMLALDRARQDGLDVGILATIYEGSTGRVRFHGVRHELIAAQAAALDLQYVPAATSPDPFEPVFERMLRDLKDRGVKGIVFGRQSRDHAVLSARTGPALLHLRTQSCLIFQLSIASPRAAELHHTLDRRRWGSSFRPSSSRRRAVPSGD